MGSLAATNSLVASSMTTHAKMPSRQSQTSSTSPRAWKRWPMIAESDLESLTILTPFRYFSLRSTWL